MSVYLHFLCGWHPRAGAQSLMTKTNVSADIGVGIVRILIDNIEKRCVNCNGIYTQATNANDACRYHPGVCPNNLFIPIHGFICLTLLLFGGVDLIQNCVCHNDVCPFHFPLLFLSPTDGWTVMTTGLAVDSQLGPAQWGATFLFGRKLNQPDDTMRAHETAETTSPTPLGHPAPLSPKQGKKI
ncbi:hypothetical protein Pelo_5849 [Pelomyxa schiedti]|nr:hypothetical protein Pelo_5849 [Pelomyxa schiedti]